MNANINEADKNHYVFFYLANEQHGEFCQWFPSTFYVHEIQIASLLGHNTSIINPKAIITFNCAEQFMMYCKAGRFRDTDTQRQILVTPDPKKQKALGKGTKGFYDAYWDEVKSEVVVAGNMAKFAQNSGLRGKLMETGNRLLVEAASKDRVWGIGYTEKHALHFRSKWGENRLGKALVEVRENLRQGLETHEAMG